MKQFQEVVITNSSKQKGASVPIANTEHSATLNVCVDIAETNEPSITVKLNNKEQVLFTDTSMEEFVLPTISFSDDRTYCYLIFTDFQVHIKIECEGVIIDVWLLDKSDDEQVVESTYLYWEELFGLED